MLSWNSHLTDPAPALRSWLFSLCKFYSLVISFLVLFESRNVEGDNIICGEIMCLTVFSVFIHSPVSLFPCQLTSLFLILFCRQCLTVGPFFDWAFCLNRRKFACWSKTSAWIFDRDFAESCCTSAKSELKTIFLTLRHQVLIWSPVCSAEPDT